MIKARRIILQIFLILIFQITIIKFVAASPVDTALAKAAEMCNVSWSPKVSFSTWQSSKGVNNTVKDINGTSTGTKFLVGHTYQGIPYTMYTGTWNGINRNRLEESQWINYLSSHNSVSDYSGYVDSVRTNSCKIGVDCSGLVQRALQAAGCTGVSGLNTSGLAKGAFDSVFNKLNSFDELRPGDILNKGGSHMVLVKSVSGNNLVVYESNATYAKCVTMNRTKSYYNGYTAYRYKDWDSAQDTENVSYHVNLVNSPTIPDGIYMIKIAGSDFALSVSGDEMVNEANIHIWEYNKQNKFENWECTYVGDGYYKILNKGSGLCLDVRGGGTAEHTNIQQYVYVGTDSQLWQIVPTGSGSYFLIPKNKTDFCLNLLDNNRANAQNIDIMPANNSDAQKMEMVRVEYSLDVNGFLDGQNDYYLANYGTVDVYVNGNLVSEQQANDYWGQWPQGYSYRIVPHENPGYHFLGTVSGSLEGIIPDYDLDVRLSYCTVNTYVFDINGFLDSTDNENIQGHGTFDLTIGGEHFNDCSDYYNGSVPEGTYFEISNIRPTDGHTYLGLHSGSLSGTINGDTYTKLSFATNQVLDVNGLLDGSEDGSLSNYGTFDIYINGARVGDDVNDYYAGSVPRGSTYEINDIRATDGHTYMGVSSGSLSGTVAGDTYTRLSFARHFTLDLNGLLDWRNDYYLSDYGTVDVYINGKLVAQGVNDYCAQWPLGYSYRIVPHENSGCHYLWTVSGSLEGTIPDHNLDVRLSYAKEYPAGPRTILDGDYSIVSAIDQNYNLDVSGNENANGTNVQLWERANYGAQHFHVERQESGYYRLRHISSGKYLDVSLYGYDPEHGNINIWDGTGGINQDWVIEESGDGCHYVIRSRVGGHALDITDGVKANGQNARLYYYDASSNAQKWFFRLEGRYIGQTVPDGDYVIASDINQNMVLDVEDYATGDGSNVQLYYNYYTQNQIFTVQYQGDGYYKIIEKKTGNVIDAANWQIARGGNVQMWHQYEGNEAGLWILRPSADGSYNIVNKYTGLYLDAPSGIVDPGTNIWCWSMLDGQPQRWHFIPVTYNTIYFDACGGKVGEQSRTGCYLGPYGCYLRDAYHGWDLPVPERTGFRFDGWYTGDGQKVDGTTINNNAGDTTLYAHWVRSDYLDLGESFYASIVWNEGQKLLSNDNRNVSIRSDMRSNNQLWRFERQSDGSYQIISVVDETRLDLYCAIVANGTNIQVHDENGNGAQKWFLYGSQSNCYIMSSLGDVVLDVESGVNQEGWNVQAWEWNDSGNQRMTIRKAYTLTFDTQGGQNGPANRTVYEDEEYALPNDIPFRDNHSFFSWRDENWVYFYPGSVIRCGGFKTLYAVWTEDGAEMPKGAARSVPDGDYIVRPVLNSDYFMDISGSVLHAAENENVQLWNSTYEGMSEFDVWTFEYLNNGFYKITQKGTDMALTVAGGSRAHTANIQVNQYTGDYSQQWCVTESLKSGEKRGVKLQCRCNGLCVDVSAGVVALSTNLQTWHDEGDGDQCWVLTPYHPVQTVADGRYILLSDMDRSIELDVSGDTGNIPDGQNVQIWHDNCPSQFNSFDAVYLGDGYYKLIHAASGKALSVQDDSSLSGTNVCVSEYLGKASQKWAIIQSGSGYILMVQSSGCALNVDNAGKEDETNVNQAFPNNASNQLWYFEKAEYALTYWLNGNLINTETKYYMQDAALYVPDNVGDGFEFLGWDTDPSASGTVYPAECWYTENKDLDLYAFIWKVAPDLILPPSLTAIEEEAFINCDFRYVRLSAGTRSVGNKSFAYCSNLRHIYIPECATFIADNAFEGDAGLVVHGRRNSYAEFYAQRHGFMFLEE